MVRKTAQYVWPAVRTGKAPPPIAVSAVHVGTASESASITADAPDASAGPGDPPISEWIWIDTVAGELRYETP
jgi:hypothetical protein